jgi:hypothetical protein
MRIYSPTRNATGAVNRERKCRISPTDPAAIRTSALRIQGVVANDSRSRSILDRDPFSILPLIQKGFPDFLELFIEALANFPPDRLLLDRAYRLLANSQEKARFALYLVEIGEVEMAIEIAETLNNDERFVRAESCDPPDLWA